jgi:hypothetical protein
MPVAATTAEAEASRRTQPARPADVGRRVDGSGGEHRGDLGPAPDGPAGTLRRLDRARLSRLARRLGGPSPASSEHCFQCPGGDSPGADRREVDLRQVALTFH